MSRADQKRLFIAVEVIAKSGDDEELVVWAFGLSPPGVGDVVERDAFGLDRDAACDGVLDELEVAGADLLGETWAVV